MYVINVTDAEFLTDFVGQGACIDDRYSEHFWGHSSKFVA
jgi:hypothetical protein